MSKAPMMPRISAMQYQVLGTLGTGAGSTILLIRDKVTGGRYALKVVKRQDEEDDIYLVQAQHEFDILRRLKHSTILRAFDCRVRRNWRLKVSGVELLLEYIDGRTIDEVELLEIGPLVLIFVQVAEGLMHMHRRGIYHGDLKPTNIMLSKDGRVKIIDFGTAWIRGEDKDRVQGTPQYMAPEQVIDRLVDERTDIYNFGATMYRMFTGRYANIGIPRTSSNGSSPTDGGVGSGGRSVGISRPSIRTPIDINPNLPGTLNEAIMTCLEVNPDRRPAGIFEVKGQLEAVARQLGVERSELRGSELEEE